MKVFRRSRSANQVIGIAFSGGGSRAASQLGALKALLEWGIEPAIVAGTSAGAVNAAWYALFPNRVDEQERIWRRLRMADVFPGGRLKMLYNLTRRGYVHEPHAWEAMLRREFGEARFEDMKVPGLVFAVDLATGKRHKFDSGPVVPALMASTAIPGVFPPYRNDSRTFVDGGVLEYLPVDDLFDRGATEVFALDCSAYSDGLDLAGPVVDRCNRIAARDSAQRVVELARSKGREVHLLQPALPEFGDARDFSHTHELIEAGYENARAYLAGLRRVPSRLPQVPARAG